MNKPRCLYRWSDAPRMVGLALLYAILARLVLTFSTANGNVTIFWIPGGLAMAALLLWRKKFWPAIFIGALAAGLMIDDPWQVSIFLALGNTLESLVGVTLLQRTTHFDISLTKTDDYLKLALVALMASGISALIGPLTLLAHGYLTPQNVTNNILHWWQADTLGILLGTPLILIWRQWPGHWFSRWRILSTLSFFLLAFLIGQILFLNAFHSRLDVLAKEYWMFLLVVLAAVNYGRHGALAIIAMTATQALWGAQLGIGLFAEDIVQTGLQNFWLFLLVLTCVGISLAINIDQQKETAKALRESEAHLKAFFDNSPIGINVFDLTGRVISVNGAARQMFGVASDDPLDNYRLFEDPAILPETKQALKKGEIAWEERFIDFQQIQQHGLYKSTKTPDDKIYIALTFTPCFTENRQLAGYIASIVDITERKTHETQIQRLTKIYAALAQTNRVARHARTETDLFEAVCRIAVEEGGMKMAWVGQCQANSERIQPIAANGDHIEYLDDIIISINPAIPEGRGPTGQALREGRAIVLQDFVGSTSTHPWHNRASRSGQWRASASFPILRSGQPYATLTLYHAEKNAFDPLIIDLLNAMIEDIGFTLDLFDTETQRIQTEEKLKLTRRVFETTQEGILITDAQCNLIEVNDAFSRITGYGREEVLGKNPRFLKSGYQDKAFYDDMWQTINRTGHWSGEIWNRRKNGEIYPEWITFSAIANDHGIVTHYVGIASDITLLKQHEKQLERIAHYDALTGIPNRVLLVDRMQQALAQSRREGKLLAICYLDLDGFKPINDTQGHDAGDKVLIAIAARISHDLRGGDTVARLGGDEFVILLQGIDNIDNCNTSLTRLLHAIARPILIQGRPFSVTASIGVTLYPHDNEDPDMLLRHADQAMYTAKRQGKNRYHIFDPKQENSPTISL